MIAATSRLPKLARGPDAPWVGAGGAWYSGVVIVLPLGSDDREPVQLEEPARGERDVERGHGQPEPTRPEDEQPGGDEDDQEPERVRPEGISPVEADGLLDARRQAAERTGHSGRRAQRTDEARVSRQHRQEDARTEHRRTGDAELARVEARDPGRPHGGRTLTPRCLGGGKLLEGPFSAHGGRHPRDLLTQRLRPRQPALGARAAGE